MLSGLGGGGGGVVAGEQRLICKNFRKFNSVQTQDNFET
jgi:hypothetical protein